MQSTISLLPLFFFLTTLTPFALAQSPTSSNSFPLATGNNPSLNPAGSPGAPSDPDSASSVNAAGASGGGDGGVDLSNGAIIAICVVVAVVVIIAVASAILFYLAKKRQWAVRASLRRSVRRLNPLTPRTKTRFDAHERLGSSHGRSDNPRSTPNRKKQPSPDHSSHSSSQGSTPSSSPPRRNEKDPRENNRRGERREISEEEKRSRQNARHERAIRKAREDYNTRGSAGSASDLEKGFGHTAKVSVTSRFEFEGDEGEQQEGGKKGWFGRMMGKR
ncbi:MAG: hypothetical protein Q9227_002003 [Pyrenula ochraceoflavens]